MARRVGLDDDPAGQRTAPGPAGDLGEELEGPLGGAIVRQVQGHVGGDHRGERHARHVEALRGELRADQDVDPAVA